MPGQSYDCDMLVGRPGLSPVMVGRAAELDRIARLPDDEDAPSVALLGGEAGIGKTRLVRELCDRLPAETRVIAGQADPGALGRPFELLLDAIKAEPRVSPEHLAVVTRLTLVRPTNVSRPRSPSWSSWRVSGRRS